MVEDDLDPARARFHESDTDLRNQLKQVDAAKDMEVDREDGSSALSAGTPESGSGPRPE